jgi:hypothetical protein
MSERTLLILGAIVCAVAVYMFANAYNIYLDQFRQSGVEVSATVLDKTSQRDSRGESYYVMFEYRAEGQSYTPRLSVPVEAYRALNVGDTAALVYLPGNHAQVILRSELDRRTPESTFAILLLAGAAVGGGVLMVMARMR